MAARTAKEPLQQTGHLENSILKFLDTPSISRAPLKIPHSILSNSDRFLITLASIPIYFELEGVV